MEGVAIDPFDLVFEVLKSLSIVFTSEHFIIVAFLYFPSPDYIYI